MTSLTSCYEILYKHTKKSNQINQWFASFIFITDSTLQKDIGTLSMCLQMIESKLTEDIASQFEYQIRLKEDVKNLAEEIVDNILFNTRYILLAQIVRLFQYIGKYV